MRIEIIVKVICKYKAGSAYILPRILHINPSKVLATRAGIFPTSPSIPIVLGHAISSVTCNPPLKNNDLSSEACIYETYI